MAAVRYSPTERRLRALLRLGEPRSTEELSTALYRGRSRPYHATKSTVGALTSLATKMDVNGERDRVARTERRGPHPISFWLEER